MFRIIALLNQSLFNLRAKKQMLRVLPDETSDKRNNNSSNDNRTETIIYGAVFLIGVLVLLLIIFFIFKKIYQKFRPYKRRDSQTKLKKNEAIKSIYDDKFGIIENEHENIRDKSMIKEFLESNVKKDDPSLKKDDKNFYISAKNVFNIEGEESEYHYDTAKKYTNRENSRESNDNEEEMGQFSQDMEKNLDTSNEMKSSREKHDKSMLNALN